MKKSVVMVMFLMSLLSAQWQPGLFATVKGVVKGDVLNVREKPAHRSKKVGSFHPDGLMMVDYCKKISKSMWCKIHPYPLTDDGGIGWVNARYLAFSNRGYVTVKGRKNNCSFVLKCEKNICLMVPGYAFDMKENSITKPRTEWIEKEKLSGSTNFGAMADNEEGYCTNGYMIGDYLQKHPDFLK